MSDAHAPADPRIASLRAAIETVFVGTPVAVNVTPVESSSASGSSLPATVTVW